MASTEPGLAVDNTLYIGLKKKFKKKEVKVKYKYF